MSLISERHPSVWFPITYLGFSLRVLVTLLSGASLPVGFLVTCASAHHQFALEFFC